MLCPAPHSSALIASPSTPLRKFLARRPSDFMCPITGSAAFLRLSFRWIAAVTPRLAPAIQTFSVLLHQPAHSLFAHPNTPGQKLLVHARPAVFLLDFGMDGTHVSQQGLVAVTPRCCGAIGLVVALPGEVPAGTDLQHLTGDARRILLSHLVNPGVPRSVSCAKYAAAFLRCHAPCAGAPPRHATTPTPFSLP